MSRIVVGGRVASAWGQGGAVWAVANWLLGLEALGHQVTLVEPILQDDGNPAAVDSVVEQAGAALRGIGVEAELVPVTAVESAAGRNALKSADLVIDLSGVLGEAGLLNINADLVLVDLDPGFTQCWARDGLLSLSAYDAHVTVGTRIGRPGCPVPTAGVEWITTVPPVWSAAWADVSAPTSGRWTTVANWRSYGSPQLDGRRLGQKAHAVRSLIDLPELTPVKVSVALDIHPEESDDLAALTGHHWDLVDPAVAATPESFRRFIADSTGEIGIAKEGYVVARTGWISDRTMAYLAAGRPAVVAATGVPGDLFPADGILTFDDAAGAAAGIATIESDLAAHGRAARAWVARHAEARRVCATVLEAVR